MEYNKDQIKLLVLETFGVSDFPAGASLLSRDSGCHESEYIKIVFAKKNWQEVKPFSKSKYPLWLYWDGRFRYDVFPYFSNEAFVYYIPTLMYYVIDDYEGADVFVDSIVLQLRKFMVEFTQKQKEVVKAFFKYLWDSYENGEAYIGILECQGLSHKEAVARLKEMEHAQGT